MGTLTLQHRADNRRRDGDPPLVRQQASEGDGFLATGDRLGQPSGDPREGRRATVKAEPNERPRRPRTRAPHEEARSESGGRTNAQTASEQGQSANDGSGGPRGATGAGWPEASAGRQPEDALRAVTREVSTAVGGRSASERTSAGRIDEEGVSGKRREESEVFENGRERDEGRRSPRPSGGRLARPVAGRIIIWRGLPRRSTCSGPCGVAG